MLRIPAHRPINHAASTSDPTAVTLLYAQRRGAGGRAAISDGRRHTAKYPCHAADDTGGEADDASENRLDTYAD